jgi:hypothetical protein
LSGFCKGSKRGAVSDKGLPQSEQKAAPFKNSAGSPKRFLWSQSGFGQKGMSSSVINKDYAEKLFIHSLVVIINLQILFFNNSSFWLKYARFNKMKLPGSTGRKKTLW